jgi:hypothetical protein
MSQHPLRQCGVNSTVFGKHPLDQPPGPSNAEEWALKARESTDVNPMGYVGPTRSASFRTNVNNVLTRFAQGTTAEGLTGVCARPEVTPLCRPRGAQRRGGQRGACPALVPGEESRVVCGARRPADAGHQHPARSGPPCDRAQVVRDERVPSSQRELAGVSHRAGTPVQPGAVSASGQARWPVWRGSGRRASTHTRQDAQSANPHLGRLSLSGDALHHVIRWNVCEIGTEHVRGRRGGAPLPAVQIDAACADLTRPSRATERGSRRHGHPHQPLRPLARWAYFWARSIANP